MAFFEHEGNDPDARGGIAPANLADYNQNHVFTGIAHVGTPGMNLTGAGTPERIFGIQASYNFLDILGVQPAMGRTFLPEEDRYGAPHVVVISHELWQQRLGGDRGVIGRTITLDGEAYQVIGVLPAGFQSPEEISQRQPMLFVVPDCWPPEILHNRGEHYDHAIARLKPGVSLAQAQSEMQTIGARLAKAYPKTNGKIALGVAPLGSDMVRRVRTAMLVLLGAVGLVLLIACANVANLLLARSAGRSREVAIRLAMGAGRGRIVRELLVESAMLAVLGCALGLALGAWTRDLLVSTAPKNIPRLDTAMLNWRVLAFTGMLATLTVFLFGMIPAWQVSGIRPNVALKSAERSTGSPAVLRWRNVLMAAEVALALMLLVGGALLWKSFVRVTGVDLGFQPDRALMMLVNLPDLRYPDGARRLAFFQELEQRVERLPGVQSAGFTYRGPMRGGWGSVYETPEGVGSEPDFHGRDADFEPVSPRYFETLGIPILKGRGFTPADKEGAPPVAIVNQVLAGKLFPNRRRGRTPHPPLRRHATGRPSWAWWAKYTCRTRPRRCIRKSSSRRHRPGFIRCTWRISPSARRARRWLLCATYSVRFGPSTKINRSRVWRRWKKLSRLRWRNAGSRQCSCCCLRVWRWPCRWSESTGWSRTPWRSAHPRSVCGWHSARSGRTF